MSFCPNYTPYTEITLEMPEYNYTLYNMDGTYTTSAIGKSFTLKELQEFVGGRIEIIPKTQPGVRGYTDVFVVCEDGYYRYEPNIHFPQFRGPVLVAHKKLVK